MNKAEIKAQIELADRVLWETRDGKSYNWMRDYIWLKDERARLVRELSAAESDRGASTVRRAR
jgi:hypothetical protein